MLSTLTSNTIRTGSPLRNIIIASFLFFVSTLFGYDANTSLKLMNVQNKTANITPMCYTKTIDNNGKIHNPCYSCHQEGEIPNFMNDSDLQEKYNFPKYALTNHWKNLFVDRSEQVAKISDNDILTYIRKDNYKDKNGNIIISEKLKDLSPAWDFYNNKKWDGYVPDCYFNFDDEGFDKAPNGTFTGWRAFAYYPFLGTFWPTNGSTDDILIRLPKDFQTDENGKFDKNIYKLNLAITEALIKQADIKIEDTDEKRYGVDLDADGNLSIAKKIAYTYDPKSKNNTMRYVGKAKTTEAKHLIGGLYPLGTEFLHTVRYLDIDQNGTVTMAPRMKELRYAVKNKWFTDYDWYMYTKTANDKKQKFPDLLEPPYGNIGKGIVMTNGWRYQGFIEDKNGDLRPQTLEENFYCQGCHAMLGATTDTTFAFRRKLNYDDFHQGWFHWKQKGFKNIKEPKRTDGKFEYTFYLKTNGAADEFRANEEAKAKFFRKDGSLKKEEITKLHGDISYLLLPSKERALKLNKAYRVIVEEQSFIDGRDATIQPLKNVHKQIDKNNESTGIKKPLKNHLSAD